MWFYITFCRKHKYVATHNIKYYILMHNAVYIIYLYTLYIIYRQVYYDI